MEIAYSEAVKSRLNDLMPGPGIVPLNRLETGNWDLLAALPALGGRNALSSLRTCLRQLTGRQHVFFAPSARAALAQVLSLLPEREVVIPAYTCWAVRAAVNIARKTMITTDVAPGSVNATSAEFEKHATRGRVLVPTHLFGIPTDIEQVCALAKDRGCTTIEDAAAFGPGNGRGLLGTIGDFGVYSFERSKRFPAFRGAAIVVNNEALISPDRFAQLEASAGTPEVPLREIASAISYNLATMAWAYRKWVVPGQLQMYANWAPPLGTQTWESIAQSKEFSGRFHPYQAALVLRMLSRVGAIGNKIEKLVSVYVNELRDSPVVTFLPQARADATMLRFPIAIPGIRRDEFLRLALQRGLYLEINYERPMAGGGGDEYPNAAWVGENVVLLPLYTSLSEASARRIAREVVDIATKHAHPERSKGMMPVGDNARV